MNRMPKRLRRLLHRRRAARTRLAVFPSGGRGSVRMDDMGYMTMKKGGTRCAFDAGKVARNGRQDWRRVISFVSDSTTATGGCIFVVVDDGGVRSGNCNGRDFFFCSSDRGEDYHHESEISYCSSNMFIRRVGCAFLPRLVAAPMGH